MSLATELARFVSPLAAAFGSERQTAVLLRELGLVERWSDVAGIPRAITDLARITNEAIATFSTLDDPNLSPAERTIRALEAVRTVLDAVHALEAVATEGLDELAFPFDSAATWETLTRALPAYLLARWLRTHHPLAHALLRLIGAVTPNDEGGEEIDFGALAAFQRDPGGTIATIAADDPSLVLEPLREVAGGLGAARPAHRLWFADGTTVLTEPLRPHPRPPGFGMALASVTPGENWSIDFDVDASEDGTPGVRLLAYLSGALNATATLAAPWSMTAALDASGATGLVLTPSGPVPAPGATTDTASLAIAGLPEVPWALIGSPGATRLELAGLTFDIQGRDLLTRPDVTIDLRTEGLRLVITAGDGDSFIADVLGGGEIAADASLAISWSSASGLTIGGRVGFDLTIPIATSVGPVTFQTLRIRAAAEPTGATTELSASVMLAIGPIDVVVEGIGLTSAVMPATERGRGAFGDLDFSLGFKTPTGLGLAVDVGVVRGGGFVSYDPEARRYAGAAELNILGAGLTAVGVLLADIPGSPGTWSMFLSLGIRLVGVQLGFGFTLNGVGGLVGVHRGLDPEALGDAVRSGALDGILFPDDPVGDALQILDAIDIVFPPVRGQYVFGPVVKIGWGTPTLVELDAGVAIQLPEPLTVSLLGALSSALPTEDVAIVDLHVAFAGTVDYTAGTLAIDASLTGSRVAGLLLTGDMAVRASFLGQPTFLASFGGFHPAFAPPAGFPKLNRLAIAIDSGDELRLSLGGYFALTSNTIQFGASAEVYATALGFVAEGGTSFDALIQIAPFGFDIRLKVWVSIQAGSIELLGVLLKGDFTGPNPWHVVGKATFKVLGISKSLEIEATIGDRRPVEAPERIAVQPLLSAEIARDDAWSVVDPDTVQAVLVSDVTGGLIVHPSGRVRLSQRIVPLDRTLEQYGTAAFEGADRFEVTPVDFDDVEDVEEYFASAQFFSMSAEEQLSAPSFTTMKAGVIFGRAGIDASVAAEMVYDHEIVYRDPAGRDRVANPRRPRASTDSALRRALAVRATPAKSAKFTVHEVGFVVVDGHTGERRSRSTDYFAARQQIGARRQVVVPSYETGADR